MSHGSARQVAVKFISPDFGNSNVLSDCRVCSNESTGHDPANDAECTDHNCGETQSVRRRQVNCQLQRGAIVLKCRMQHNLGMVTRNRVVEY